jgi:hypothetical protein
VWGANSEWDEDKDVILLGYKSRVQGGGRGKGPEEGDESEGIVERGQWWSMELKRGWWEIECRACGGRNTSEGSLIGSRGESRKEKARRSEVGCDLLQPLRGKGQLKRGEDPDLALQRGRDDCEPIGDQRKRVHGQLREDIPRRYSPSSIAVFWSSCGCSGHSLWRQLQKKQSNREGDNELEEGHEVACLWWDKRRETRRKEVPLRTHPPFNSFIFALTGGLKHCHENLEIAHMILRTGQELEKMDSEGRGREEDFVALLTFWSNEFFHEKIWRKSD